jgi:hypothetical protein
VTTGVQLQTSAGRPSFDSSGTVQGRLEIEVDGDWVTVSGYGDSFGGAGSSGGEAESEVACRQLANELGSRYELVDANKVKALATDDGTGESYKVKCSGPEPTLTSCPKFEAGGNGHQLDVGVACTFLVPGEDCEECAAGKFSDVADAAACNDCPAGSANAAAGSTSAGDCKLCGAGTASAAGSVICAECEAGRYASFEGASACSFCSPGKANANAGSISVDDCLECPENSAPGGAGAAACVPEESVVSAVYVAIGVAAFLLIFGKLACELSKVNLEAVGLDESQKQLQDDMMGIRASHTRIRLMNEQLEEEVRLKKHSEEELKVMVNALEAVSKERRDELKEVMMDSKELTVDRLLGKGG